MSSVPHSLISDHASARSLETHVFQERDFGGDAALRLLLLDFPGALEPGLQILDAVGKASPSARFDILALDRSRRLVLVEAAAQDADALFLRSLDHYAWTLENLELVHRMHPEHAISAAPAPRILLAMPEIPERLRARTRLLRDLDVMLVEIHLLETEGARGLWGREVARYVAEGAPASGAEDEHPTADLEEEELRALMDPLTA